MSLAQKLLQSRFIGGEHARSGLLSFAIIMVGSALQFIMFSLSARVLGPHDFGFFAFVFNITSFLSVAGVLGQEKLITRLWHEYSGSGHVDRAVGALVFTTLNTVGGAIVMAGGVVVTGWLMGYPLPVLAGAAVLTAIQVILSFTSNAARPIAGLAAGAGLFEITWRLLTIIVLLVIYFAHIDIDTPALMMLLAVSMLVSIVLQLVLMRRAVPFQGFQRAAAEDRAEWWQRSAKMWGSAVVEAATQFADVIIIGLVFDFVSAGAYFAATRIASALHRVSLGATNLAGTKVSLLYYHRPREELRAFIHSLSSQTTALALCGFIGLVILGKPLLALFGPSYVSEYWTLLIVASGALVTAVFCIAPQLLLQTGHEGFYLRIISIGLAVRLALLAILIQQLGTIGAAIAVVIVNVATSVALNLYCRQRVGVDASIFASVWPVKPTTESEMALHASADAQDHNAAKTTDRKNVAARHRIQELVETPKAIVGGVEMLALDRAETADLVVRLAKARRGGDEPVTISSANGEVISRCATDARIADLHREMDIINADGQSLVFASRLFCGRPLPERVATTDFFHDVVRRGLDEGVTHYMLGASPEENIKAQERVRSLYPSIRLLGGIHGYLSAAEMETKVAEINALKPDVLWVALGVPGQQEFCLKFGKALSNVGVIQTCGGLFNFLSGTRMRAPEWMQRAGLEWLYRIKEEPRRLLWRYAVTNPHAMYLLARYSA